MAAAARGRLDFACVGDGEFAAVVTRLHRAGVIVIDEVFRDRIELQLWPERELRPGQIDLIRLEMLNRPIDRIKVVVIAGVVGEVIFELLDCHAILLAEVVGDIPHVSQTGRQMPAAGVGVELLGRAVENALNKVREMILIAAPLKALDLLPVEIKGDTAPVRLLNDVSLGPVGDRTDFRGKILASLQPACLKDKSLPAVVVIDRNLGIGGITGIDVIRVFLLDVVAEPPAVGYNTVGKNIRAEKNTGDIELVRTLITAVAVAVDPLPMPVVMKIRPRQRKDLGRTGPDIIVDRLRYFILTERTDRLAAVIAQTAGELDLADLAVANVPRRLDNRRIRTALRSNLAAECCFWEGI